MRVEDRFGEAEIDFRYDDAEVIEPKEVGFPQYVAAVNTRTGVIEKHGFAHTDGESIAGDQPIVYIDDGDRAWEFLPRKERLFVNIPYNEYELKT